MMRSVFLPRARKGRKGRCLSRSCRRETMATQATLTGCPLISKLGRRHGFVSGTLPSASFGYSSAKTWTTILRVRQPRLRPACKRAHLRNLLLPLTVAHMALQCILRQQHNRPKIPPVKPRPLLARSRRMAFGMVQKYDVEARAAHQTFPNWSKWYRNASPAAMCSHIVNRCKFSITGRSCPFRMYRR
jgi:hypothetical protein